MSRTNKSPRAILRVAHRIDEAAPPADSHPNSPGTSTRRQVFARPALKSAMKLDHRRSPKLGPACDCSDHPIIGAATGLGPRPDVDASRGLLKGAPRRARARHVVADAGYDAVTPIGRGRINPSPGHRTTMLASRLILSVAALGLAPTGSPTASAQDSKSPATSPGTGKDQGQAPKDEGRGGGPTRPGGRGPRGMPPMPKMGPTVLPILPALPTLDDTAFYAKADVPHGKVEPATYANHAGKDKRMHVYLPPGYEAEADARYPVLYLNHGGGDDDSKWTSTDPRQGGHAQFILDNLIAAGKARPMIVVMPNTSGIASPEPPKPGEDDAVTREYLKDIIPHVETHYRARPGREDRALAGLSMGGFVVMNTGLSHLDTFGELYVYSSGYFPDRIQAFEENFKGVLGDPRTNLELLRVPFYMAQGETDIALANGQQVMSVVNKYGVRNFWVLSTGGHEWANWRRYLHQTAQVMFPEDRKK